MKNLEEFEKALEESNYIKVSYLKSTWSDGVRASYTLSHREKLSGEYCEVITNQITLEDGTLVTSHIVTDTEYGRDSVPCGGTFLGERVGVLQLSSILTLLPSIYKDKVSAQNYLAENPEMLISKLSNILQIQQEGLSSYKRTLQDLDWNLAGVYEESSTKGKKFFKMLTGYIFKKNGDVFKRMRELVEKED